jgi:methylenetetrahydrofolate dehydrogenase (NADP+) / methenyltetrahydrofolate cyclohydrolase
LTAKILDGRILSEEILGSVRRRISLLDRKPGLAVILVGEDPASVLYTGKKLEACERAGICSEEHRLADPEEDELASLILQLNKNESINGILIQLPLPQKIGAQRILSLDGFGPVSLGSLMLSKPRLVSCTALGIIKLLKRNGIEVEGKDIVIIGDSVIIGRPLSQLLLNEKATVTVCHTKTRDLVHHTRRADILISATGVPGIIKKGMVKVDAVVVDVGATVVEGRVVGDVNRDVYCVASYITPVPGGVGPMTVACLMENTLQSYLGEGSKL